ncbi:protein of unknown function [Shewanella benthica]|uniref:Uncharacterized protein n=1 Tax=Shewanella benthica TaxID=43661 RepID=A0A330M041_9GAMM|nr:protein of unknown function [Shewanella benthica]
MVKSADTWLVYEQKREHLTLTLLKTGLPSLKKCLKPYSRGILLANTA